MSTEISEQISLIQNQYALLNNLLKNKSKSPLRVITNAELQNPDAVGRVMLLINQIYKSLPDHSSEQLMAGQLLSRLRYYAAHTFRTAARNLSK